jgi:preprotein translocase subunit SecG
MITVVVAIHLMLVLAMIGVVLLQKSEGGGLVSSTSGFMTGRGTANVLTRTTALLAAGFFITSLVLSLLAGHGRAPVSLINTGGNGAPAEQAPAPGGPAPPMAPLNSGNNGLLNQLGGNPPAGNAAAPAPAAPAPAPSGPEVPQSR